MLKKIQQSNNGKDNRITMATTTSKAALEDRNSQMTSDGGGFKSNIDNKLSCSGEIIIADEDVFDFVKQHLLSIRTIDLKHPAILAAIQGVENVFLGRDFVSVSKAGNTDWSMLKPMILAALMVRC